MGRYITWHTYFNPDLNNQFFVPKSLQLQPFHKCNRVFILVTMMMKVTWQKSKTNQMQMPSNDMQKAKLHRRYMQNLKVTIDTCY